MDPYRVIKRPHVSEKTHEKAEELNTYTFVVDMAASKDDIRNALSVIWGVVPVSVRTCITHGKRRRYGRSYGTTAPVKKAMVRLPEGQAIEVLK